MPDKTPRSTLSTVTRTIALLVVVGIGVRVAAWLLAPALPYLVGVFVMLAVVTIAVRWTRR